MQEEGISVYKREAFPKPLSKYIPFKSIQKDFTLKKSGRALESKKYKFLDKKKLYGLCKRDSKFFFLMHSVCLKCILILYILLSSANKKYIYGFQWFAYILW